MLNASRFCVSSLRKGHADLLCLDLILVCVFKNTQQRDIDTLYTEVVKGDIEHWKDTTLREICQVIGLGSISLFTSENELHCGRIKAD